MFRLGYDVDDDIVVDDDEDDDGGNNYDDIDDEDDDHVDVGGVSALMLGGWLAWVRKVGRRLLDPGPPHQRTTPPLCLYFSLNITVENMQRI